MKIAVILLSITAALALLAILGLKIRPASFSAFPGEPTSLGSAPLPDGLPGPVERFYRQTYGEQVPVIESAVISGRATLRLGGVTFPGRFRFTHQAGQNYRHYLEATVFGRPLFKVNEHYLEGQARLELPFGVVENDPNTNQAANLGLWAESMWLPAIYITDPRVRWAPVDDESALLVAPFGEEEQSLLVRFDPESGIPRFIEAMRFKESDSRSKSLWINETRDWGELNGNPTFTQGAITWFEDGTPWAIFYVEEVVYNVDVREYVRGRGE